MKVSSTLFAIALIFIVVVLCDLFLWFSVTANIMDFEAAKQEYLSHYPAALQNGRLLTVISLLMLTFSGYIFINMSKSNENKKAGLLLGLLSTLLLIAKIFTLTK